MGRRHGIVRRLYMVPGMQHCAGGPGRIGSGRARGARARPEHDVDAAIERWVEQGVAPARIVAARYTDAGAASGVSAHGHSARTRRWRATREREARTTRPTSCANNRKCAELT